MVLRLANLIWDDSCACFIHFLYLNRFVSSCLVHCVSIWGPIFVYANSNYRLDSLSSSLVENCVIDWNRQLHFYITYLNTDQYSRVGLHSWKKNFCVIFSFKMVFLVSTLEECFSFLDSIGPEKVFYTLFIFTWVVSLWEHYLSYRQVVLRTRSIHNQRATFEFMFLLLVSKLQTK